MNLEIKPGTPEWTAAVVSGMFIANWIIRGLWFRLKKLVSYWRSRHGSDRALS